MHFLKQKSLGKKNLFVLTGGIVIAVVVSVTYYSGLSVGFWSDDYAFLETAARLSFREYLAWYFDPRLQALWYRPIPGMLWWVEWHLFYGNALGYHLVYVLIHLASCLLIYAIAARVSKDWMVGFVSALVYAGISAYSLAVLRPSDETALAAFFYLLTIFFWLSFVLERRERQRAIAYVCFVLALLSKEASVTLPVILFLVDFLLVGGKNQVTQRVRRYLPFALMLIPYLALEITIAPNTQYRLNLGYGFGIHMIPVLGEYLSWLAFPWGLNPPLNYLWLGFVVLILAFILVRRRDRRWLFLVVGTLVVCAPYIPFQFFFERFLYLPMMLSSIAIGSALVWLCKRFASTRWQTLLIAGLGCIVTINGLGTMSNTDWLIRFAREGRIPLRTIDQWHPSFPEDTLLYFINPPVPLYGGMFYLRYGSQVSVAGDIGTYQTIWRNVVPEAAGLRNHNAAFVYYFDNRGEIKEQRVSKDVNARINPNMPVNFQSLIVLDGYEIANTQVERGGAVLVLLYWKAEATIVKDYTVFAHLLDENGDIVTGFDSQPRSGNSHTSSWQVGDRVVDWIVLPISDQVTPGTDYHLEFGLYDQATTQRLGIVDGNNQINTDRVIVSPITIVH